MHQITEDILLKMLTAAEKAGVAVKITKTTRGIFVSDETAAMFVVNADGSLSVANTKA